ncbi:unnamed protein product [Prunus armeniaca]|uniref:Uncharacterized protein n=1 Tax=Prunus armeniaca TaxID=36596 RepID=A0A6J5WEW3_PRUAR|nr:unnamed protein product [Prunus armeniaca]
MVEVVLLDLLRPLISPYPHICPQRLNRCRPRSICRVPPRPQRHIGDRNPNLGLMVSYIVNTLNSKYVAFFDVWLIFSEISFFCNSSLLATFILFLLTALAAFHCAETNLLIIWVSYQLK